MFNWQTVAGALGSVAVILVLVGAGIYVQRRQWFPGDSWKALSRLVVNLCVPCAIFIGLTDGFDRASLHEFGGGALISAVTILITALLCVPLMRLLRIPAGRRGVFISICAFTNSVFIGVPMTEMLFGAHAVRYAYIAFLANSTLFWTLGAALIRRDGQPGSRFFESGWWRKILSPSIIALIAGLVFVCMGWRTPFVAARSIGLLADMSSPLALLYCGMQIGALSWRRLKPDASLVVINVMRFVVSPALCIALCLSIAPAGADPLLLRVLVVQAAMPAMAQISIVAGLYGADAEYASAGFLVTTALSVLATPLLMLVITAMF